MPPVARRAPYKDFLQPALQRRFASTALVLLAIAYAQGLTFSTWDSFIWSWFPLGMPGLRAFAIFACVLPLVILRIAHSHIGLRTSASPFQTFTYSATKLSTLETLVTYAISSFMFGQLYLFSLPQDSQLQWINHHPGDRLRLNERALFYTVNLLVLGVAVGVKHITLDLDRLRTGVIAGPRDGQTQATRQPDPWDKLSQKAGRLVFSAGTVAIAVGLVNYFFLYSFLRQSAWGWALLFFRPFYSLPRTSIAPPQGPWSVYMLSRSIWAGFLICMLWDFGSLVFTLQLQREPLKNQQPLTSESKDPNGSLLNGLKSKKERIQAFATWELAFISRDFEVRRKAIFEDIDRKDGPVWSQIYAICSSTLKSVEQRIDDYGKPPAPPATAQPAAEVPRPLERSAQAPKAEDVWAPVAPPKGLRGSLGKAVSGVATSPGKTPMGSLGPEAKKKWAEATGHLLSKEQREALSSEGVNARMHTMSARIMAVPYVGCFFQETLGRRLNKAVLGTPYGEVRVYVNAAFALTQLAVSSLAEDKYGNVQRDVPALLRTFTVLIKKTEAFRDGFPRHWSDLSGDRSSAEVEELLDALKDGLGRLVEAFGPYSSDLRLSRADMRLAKEAAGVQEGSEGSKASDKQTRALLDKPEMQQVR